MAADSPNALDCDWDEYECECPVCEIWGSMAVAD